MIIIFKYILDEDNIVMIIILLQLGNAECLEDLQPEMYQELSGSVAALQNIAELWIKISLTHLNIELHLKDKLVTQIKATCKNSSLPHIENYRNTLRIILGS